MNSTIALSIRHRRHRHRHVSCDSSCVGLLYSVGPTALNAHTCLGGAAL